MSCCVLTIIYFVFLYTKNTIINTTHANLTKSHYITSQYRLLSIFNSFPFFLHALVYLIISHTTTQKWMHFINNLSTYGPFKQDSRKHKPPLDCTIPSRNYILLYRTEQFGFRMVISLVNSNTTIIVLKSNSRIHKIVLLFGYFVFLHTNESTLVNTTHKSIPKLEISHRSTVCCQFSIFFHSHLSYASISSSVIQLHKN